MMILIDQREKQPWTFRDIREKHPDADFQTRLTRIYTGDYTLEGFEDRIVIERKSQRDAYFTLQQDFKRFDNEFSRMNNMEAAWVVVEAPLSRYAGGSSTDYYQMLACVHKKHHVLRSMMSLMIRYPRIRWKFCQTPEEAEWFTFLQLLKFHQQAKSL